MGRPPRFKSPSEMQKEIEQFFMECESKGEVPLISWMEHKLGFRFRDYAEKEEFEDVCNWAKEESEAICEQLAFLGRMTKVAARLYLSCKRGYVVEKKIELNQTSNLNIENFQKLLADVEALPEDAQKRFDKELMESVGYAEEL